MTKIKLNTYTLEFKESAIKLALDSDESIPQIAKNLGVSSNTLYTWVHNASKPKGNTYVASNESTENEIKRFKTQVRRKSFLIRQENPTIHYKYLRMTE
jgi:transposase